MAGSRITTRLDNLESAFGRLKASQQDLQRQLNILNPKSEYLKEINSDLMQAETRITELTRRSNGLRDEMNDIIEKNTTAYEKLEIPAELAQTINLASPPCKYYGGRGGRCMRGKKCPMRHTRHVGPTTELPFTANNGNRLP